MGTLKRLCYIFLFLLIAGPACYGWDAGETDCDDADGTTFCVPALTTLKRTIDGDTYCSGVCDKNDTIYLEAGTHGCLTFQDFDGVDDYITITNEDSATRVTFDIQCNSTDDQVGGVIFRNVEYLDFRGDGYSSHSWTSGTTSSSAYGFYIDNDLLEGSKTQLYGVKIEGETQHLKIGYIEVDSSATFPLTGTYLYRGGWHLNDNSNYHMDSTFSWEDIEIHHTYTHNVTASCMYLGENNPGTYDVAYTGKMLVHDNICVDIGASAITLKGKDSTSDPSLIYNNIVKNTGLGCGALGASCNLEDSSQCTEDNYAGTQYMECCDGEATGTCAGTKGNSTSGSFRAVDHATNADYNYFNNYSENSLGPGIWIETGPHLIYNNIFVNNGNGLDDKDVKAVGILVALGSKPGTVEVYDNIIIDPDRYGILNKDGTMHMERNLIGGAPYGEWYDYPGSEDTTTEGTGENENIFHASVSDFNFNTWSDDSNYSNDVFTTWDLVPPNNGAQVSVNPTLTWTNAEGVTGISLYFECGDSSPDVLVVDDNLQESYSATAPINSTCYWQIITHGTTQGDGTGDIYVFYTSDAPETPPEIGASDGAIFGGDIRLRHATGGVPIVFP